jgi:hypothetical protein
VALKGSDEKLSLGLEDFSSATRHTELMAGMYLWKIEAEVGFELGVETGIETGIEAEVELEDEVETGIETEKYDLLDRRISVAILPLSLEVELTAGLTVKYSREIYHSLIVAAANIVGKMKI